MKCDKYYFDRIHALSIIFFYYNVKDLRNKCQMSAWDRRRAIKHLEE